jgi:L-ribulokinase
MKISKSEQAPALGAAIFASVAAGSSAGGYNSIQSAQSAMTGIGGEYTPVPENHRIYRQLYILYRQLYDGFGTRRWSGRMYNVMKKLLDIRDEVRSSRT